MRYFCSPNQKTVLRTRRIVELRSGPKDAKVAKKVPYLECGAVGKKSRFMKKSLIALAFGTLALGMAEFVMMGILPDVARDLGVSIPRAGDLISAYAIGVCVGAPATVLIARKRALKGILLALAALIVLGNVCASLAPDFWVLLAMRFVSGLPHGAFFGVGSIVAERVADPGHKTQAVSIMILGMTVANLFCVPLGTYLGSYLSWQLSFVAAGFRDGRAVGNYGSAADRPLGACPAGAARYGIEGAIPVPRFAGSLADFVGYAAGQWRSFLLVQLRDSDHDACGGHPRAGDDSRDDGRGAGNAGG